MALLASPSLRVSLRVLLARQRRRLRKSEAAFIALAALAGALAGLLAIAQQMLAHGLQRLLYGVSVNRLSALGSIHHPWRLLALPLGGLLLVALTAALRRRVPAPVDVVEANALHGGRIPPADSLSVSAQTILSNGAGASVGLEAAYAQMGGGAASLLGVWLGLRRNDLRTLVGAGAGSAIAAAFGAPLTGAFYAFEIVIGTYSPATIAPVLAASLAAVSLSHALGIAPYLIATTATPAFPLSHYLAFAVLGLACALLGIVIMRLVAAVEQATARLGRWTMWRPVIGGLLLIPLALVSPQTLSAGHGALHLDLVLRPTIAFLATVLALKIAASVVSLAFGFRGGLFFASLFLGSIVGQIFAAALDHVMPGLAIDPQDAALVGMAALSVSIVGGPMTLSILMLEITHDFALMGVVLLATLLSSAVTRELFGYSFSTWRLHLRGSRVRSPRDIGWTSDLPAGRIMRRDFVAVPAALTIGQFRAAVPIGTASKVVALDDAGHYAGILATAAGHASDVAAETPLAALLTLRDVAVARATPIDVLLTTFDREVADEIAVVDDDRRVMGIVTEVYARRRYFEELDRRQREIFGER